jgi:LynF/TruF/PatF family peptide O-prenyltransferase
MRAHQEAFDVEPVFPIPLFEEAVLEIEGSCGVEPMCHVQGDQLFAVDFQVSNEEHTWPSSWSNAVKFLDRVESKVGIRLNRGLLDRFVAEHMGSHKILNNTIGIDLRPKLEHSCIKIYIHIELEEDPEELVRTAIKLDGGSYSVEMLQVLLKSSIIIGFNIFLNGYTNVEFWAASLGEQYKTSKFDRGKYLKYYIQKNLSPKVNLIFGNSTLLAVIFSKEKNVEPLLVFHYEELKDIQKNFSFNSLGERIYNFCQSQDCITYGGVYVTERELEKDRLENFSIFYNKRDQCQPLPFLSTSDI